MLYVCNIYLLYYLILHNDYGYVTESVDAEVDRSIWWHFLVIHVPDNIDPALKNSGFLFVDEGENENPETLPDISDMFIAIAGLLADGTNR